MILNYDEVRDKVESVQGYLPAPQPAYLFRLVTFSPLDSIIVEIGSYFGRSSVAMGFACLGTNRKLYSIDVWENEHIYLEWQKTIKEFGLEDHVIPIRGWSGEILLDLGKFINGNKIYMSFIDGGHGLANVLNDFILIYPWVKNDGIIAFHDVCEGHPEVLKAWEILKALLVNHEKEGSLALGRKTLIK